MSHKDYFRNNNSSNDFNIHSNGGRAGLRVSAVDCYNLDQGSMPMIGNLYPQVATEEVKQSKKSVFNA